jgi:hypothetical protein
MPKAGELVGEIHSHVTGPIEGQDDQPAHAA